MEFLQVQSDPIDPNYALSFEPDDLQQAKAFFEEYGYVVFRNIFTPEECEQTRDAMWRIIEDSTDGFNRNDSSTWSLYRSAGKYGLSMRGPCFHPTLVKNRQNPRLIKALKAIIDSDDLMVSHDRYTIYRATGPEIENGESYRTGCRNVHLDLNPWWWCESSRAILDGLSSLTYQDQQEFIRENNLIVRSMGPHVQCVLNFENNLSEDGGTIVVPGFHKQIDQWCETTPIVTNKAQAKDPITYPNHVPKDPIPWLNFPSSNQLLDRAQRVPMRAGSMLCWNQTVVHGTSPNSGTNRCRMAQFLKAFDGKQSISSDRLKLRTRALVKALVENEVVLDELSEEGKRVFGLDSIEAEEIDRIKQDIREK